MTVFVFVWCENALRFPLIRGCAHGHSDESVLPFFGLLNRNIAEIISFSKFECKKVRKSHNMFTFSGFNIHWVWLAVLSARFCRCHQRDSESGSEEDGLQCGHGAADHRGPSLFCWGIVSAKSAAGQISGIDRQTWILLILSGVATRASWLCYFKALQMANVNRVAPIDKLSTVLHGAGHSVFP